MNKTEKETVKSKNTQTDVSRPETVRSNLPCIEDFTYVPISGKPVISSKTKIDGDDKPL